MASNIGKHDDRLESSLVGAMLIGGSETIDIAVEMLKPTDLYDPKFRAIFKAIGEQHAAGKHVDEVTIAGLFTDTSYRDVVGRCIYDCPSAAAVEHYATGVRDLALARAMMDLSVRIGQAIERGGPAGEVLNYVSKETDRIQARLAGRESEPQSIAALAKRFVGQIGEAKRFSGLACGVGDGVLDLLTDGWEANTYTVLAARTSLGKSTLGLAIMRGIFQCNAGGGFPLVISTEMSELALARKDLACAAGLSSRDLKRSNLDMGQKLRIRDAIKDGKLDGVYVASMGGASMEQVRAVAKRHKRKFGLPVLLVDLAQQLGSPLKSKDPTGHCSLISGALANLKTELDCAVIACVQINRSVSQEGIGDERGRPQLHHLKQAGAWEEDCDKALLLHRPAYWGGADKRTEVIFAKDRDGGETGSCFIEYDKSTGRFRDATFREEKK